MMLKKRRLFSGSSKGQVTVFIIIGLVLLFIGGGIFYLTKTVAETKLTAEKEPIIAAVPSQFAPLKLYTENCLAQVAQRGLVILGQQGGYIYPDLVGEYSLDDPTNSDGLNLESAKIPYWFYNKEHNFGEKVVLASLQPELSGSSLSVEAQLSRFIDEKVGECLADYDVFKAQGYTIEVKEPETSSVVSADSVNFLLEMDVKAGLGGAEVTMKQFYVKIPLKLKEYFAIAQNIANLEEEFRFLEKQSLDLIQIYSGVDINKLPPTSEVTFELAPRAFWNEVNVKSKLQELLTSNIPLLKFLGANNFYRYEYPVSDLSNLFQSNYDQTVLPLDRALGKEINFNYFSWPMHLNMNSENGKIAPMSLVVHYDSIVPLHFGTQHYYTVYDLSFPVLVTIKDPDAFKGDGFVFNLALEANIRNNLPAKNEQEVTRTVTSLKPTQVCDEEQWNSGIIRSIVVDAEKRNPVEAVQINFQIPEQDTCNMGETNAFGVFESTFPKVYGGVMSLIKEDYLTAFYPIDTYKKTEPVNVIGYAVADFQEKVIEMYPAKKIKVSAQKKELGKCIMPLKCSSFDLGIYKEIDCERQAEQCFFNTGILSSAKGEAVAEFKAEGSLTELSKYYFLNQVKSLVADEEVIISLNRVKGFNEQVVEAPFQTVVTLQGDSVQEIVLYPGVYAVQINLLSRAGLAIPQDRRCTRYTVLTRDVEECYDVDSLVMDSFLEGSLAWDKPEMYFVVTPEDLYGAEELVFSALGQNVQDLPEDVQVGGSLVNTLVIEDLQLMGEMAKISQLREIRNKLQPKFK